MPTPAVKICGVRTPDALEAVLRARVEHVGLNFYPPSPRFVSLEEAARLGAQARGRINRVGLFVNADDSAIGDAVAAAELDTLQLHGDETPERTAQLRARFGLPVWKVIPVASADDVGRAARYDGAADFILFDARTPKGTLPGGMGLAFDWSLLSGHRSGLPWGLAGGLSPETVGEAIARTGASLVDTASGVESALGVKDADRIAAFALAVRGLA